MLYEANLQNLVSHWDKRSPFIVERTVLWAQLDRRVDMTLGQACEALNRLLAQYCLATANQVTSEEVLEP
jgi:hypothetical protein